ncbi:MAG: RNA methyltransferase [Agathobacter sp.]|nr:RNA methyltransferase [Agathobacter sp.]
MITSASNQQIKNLTALMKKSKERKKQGVFVVEGPKMCFEAPNDWVKAVYVSESYISNPDNDKKIKEYLNKCNGNVTYEVVVDSVFKNVSDTKTPQGIISLVKIPQYELKDTLNKDKSMVLILESIQDPGNLGTMIRTGEGAGVTGVIMNNTTVDIFNPKTIRSTMGSIYRVPFYITNDLKESINVLKENGINLYAAHLKGEASYDEMDYRKASGFLIGNEGNGLSDEIANMADSYIKIPMEGKVESLNAAISATLLMYECNRQRRSAK